MTRCLIVWRCSRRKYRIATVVFVKIIEGVFKKTAIFCLKNLFFLAGNRYFCSVKSVKIGHFLVKVFKNALKLSDSQRNTNCTLREHYPLQQGLRLLWNIAKSLLCGELREHYPLQQGLRRLLKKVIVSVDFLESTIHYNKD